MPLRYYVPVHAVYCTILFCMWRDSMLYFIFITIQCYAIEKRLLEFYVFVRSVWLKIIVIYCISTYKSFFYIKLYYKEELESQRLLVCNYCNYTVQFFF